MQPFSKLIQPWQILGPAFALLLLLAVACGGAAPAAPVVVEKEVQVEKEAVVEKEVIKEVEKVVVVTPTPVPAPAAATVHPRPAGSRWCARRGSSASDGPRATTRAKR